MFNSNLLNKTHELAKWISHLAFINILWLFFTIIGGIVLGFFPATMAMILTLKKVILEKEEINIRKEFIHNYKNEFRNSNKVFFPFIIAHIILIIDINFLNSFENKFINYLVVFFYILTFILIMIFLYSLILFTSNKPILRILVSKSIKILLTRPITNLLIVMSLILVFTLTKKITGFIIFFSGSFLSAALILIVINTVKPNQS